MIKKNYYLCMKLCLTKIMLEKDITFEIEYNTSKMKFDPVDKNFYELFREAVPSIYKIKTHGGILKKSIACYTCLMYDRNSPLIKAEPLYWKRKILAANLAKFPTGKKGMLTDNATKILTGEDETYLKVVLDYLDLFALPEFDYLVGLQIIQSEYLMQIMRGQISNDSDKVLGRVANSIAEVTRKIYQTGEEEEVAAARKAIYEKAVRERANLRPEDFAEMLARTRELPKEFSPYGEDYVPDKLKYIGDNEETALRKLSLIDEEE